MPAPRQRRALIFEDFQIDLDRGSLLRGGEIIPLRPQSFEVLKYLAENAGRLVTKEELMESVWEGRAVTDDSITQCISDVRSALDDRERDKVRTVPRRGVVFELAVEEVSPESGAGNSSPRRNSKSWLAWAGLMLAIAALAVFYWPSGDHTEATPVRATPPTDQPQTLAVLPFADLTAERNQGHMADGLVEELIMELSQVDGLRVTGRTSAFTFREHDEDLPTIAETLGVEHILEGSVRRSGDQWRITAQLIEARSGFTLWTDTFDRPLQDFFDIQDEIATAVTDALLITLGLGGWDSPYATDNLAAYEQFRLGEEKLWKTMESTQEGLEHLRRAIALDPEYTYVWGKIANVISVIKEAHSMDWEQQAINHLNQALELSPQSAEQRYNAAEIYGRLNDFERASEFLAEAEALSDMPFLGSRADLNIKVGRPAEAEELARQGLRLDPLNLYLQMHLAQALASQGKLNEAMAVWNELVHGDDQIITLADQALTTALSMRDPEQILHWIELTLRADPEYDTVLAMRERLTDEEAAIDWLRTAYKSGEEHLGPEEHWGIMNFAAYFGDSDFVMDILEARPDTWSVWLPHFADVRSTPRFKQWVEDIGLTRFWQEHGWSDYCQPAEGSGFRCF